MNLFGDDLTEEDKPTDGKHSAIGAAKLRNGIAGHNLVLADLLIRGHEGAIMDGVDTDIIAIVHGEVRKFQVKASMNSLHFGPSGLKGETGYRPLSSYQGKIDGIAFVYLAKKAIYYVHPDAINSSHLTLPESIWGRQQCDMSFSELLRRWNATRGLP